MAYTLIAKGQITSANLDTLAKKMNWTRREALGCVTLLWHSAQSSETDVATKERIAEWCEHSVGLVDALLEASYVEIRGSEYFIKDMERQLVSVRRSRSKGSKKERSAGSVEDSDAIAPGRSVIEPINVPEVETKKEEIPSDASVLEIKEIEPEEIHVKENLAIVETHVETRRPDLVVPKKTRGKKAVETENEKRARLMKSTPGVFVWQAYEKAYFERYTISPQRNAKANVACKSISERVGIENAINVVRFYLRREDAFYVNSAHEIGLCLRDCQKLVTEMKTGKPISLSEARRRETTEETSRAIQDYLKSQGGTQ